MPQCYNHQQSQALGTCRYCGRHLCSDCLLIVDDSEGEYYCCENDDDCLAYQEKQDHERIQENITMQDPIIPVESLEDNDSIHEWNDQKEKITFKDVLTGTSFVVIFLIAAIVIIGGIFLFFAAISDGGPLNNLLQKIRDPNLRKACGLVFMGVLFSFVAYFSHRSQGLNFWTKFSVWGAIISIVVALINLVKWVGHAF